MMKQVAVIQCTSARMREKRTSTRPERPSLDPHHAADQIEDDQHREHADNGDGADPAQRHLVEMPPVAAGGLLDGVGSGSGMVPRPWMRLSSCSS